MYLIVNRPPYQTEKCDNCVDNILKSMFLWIDNLFGPFWCDVWRANRCLSRCHNALFRFGHSIDHISREMCFLLTYELIVSFLVATLSLPFTASFPSFSSTVFLLTLSSNLLFIDFKSRKGNLVIWSVSFSYACHGIRVQVCPMFKIWYLLVRSRIPDVVSLMYKVIQWTFFVN